MIESTSTRWDRWWVVDQPPCISRLRWVDGWCLTTAGFPPRHRSELGNGCIVRKFSLQKLGSENSHRPEVCAIPLHTRDDWGWLLPLDQPWHVYAPRLHRQFSMLFVACVNVGGHMHRMPVNDLWAGGVRGVGRNMQHKMPFFWGGRFRGGTLEPLTNCWFFTHLHLVLRRKLGWIHYFTPY